MSFGTEQKHIDPFFSKPVEQGLLAEVVFDVNLVNFLKNDQTFKGHF